MTIHNKIRLVKKPNTDHINERLRFAKFCKLQQELSKKPLEELSEEDFKQLKDVIITDYAEDLSKFEMPDCRKEILTLVEQYISGMENNGLKSNRFKGFEKALNLWQPGLYLVGGTPNSGKFLPNHTEIATPNGFKLNGDLKIGDYVIGKNGKQTKVIGVFPQGIKPIYNVIMADGSSLEAGLDHLWYVETHSLNKKGNRINKILKTSEIMNDMNEKKGTAKRSKWCIPRVDKIEFIKRELKIKPYTLGILISEGGLTDKGYVKFTNTDTEIIERVRSEINCKESLSNSGLTFRVKRNDVLIGTREYLKEFGLFGKYEWEKFIPEDYLMSDIDDRIDLLRGLMDGDGYVNKNLGFCEYSTTSEMLKNDVIQLVRSLGGRVSCTERMGKYKKNGEYITTRKNYRVFIKFCNDVNPFFISRKANIFKPCKKQMNYIKAIDYVGDYESTCIAVDADDHLYTGGKDFVISHNSTLMQNIFLDIVKSNDNVFGIMVSMDDSKNDVYTRFISTQSGGKIKTEHVKFPNSLETTQYNIPDRNGVSTTVYAREILENSIESVIELADEKMVVLDSNTIGDFSTLSFFVEKAIKRNPNKKIVLVVDAIFNVEVEGSAGDDVRNQNIKRANLIKKISDKHDIVVIASVELRKLESKFGYQDPKLSDIMESGKFGYNAKCVIMICFQGDDEIDEDLIHVKAKFVKNKISSFRGSKYVAFDRPSGYMSENSDIHRYKEQFQKDQESVASGFIKNKKQF